MAKERELHAGIIEMDVEFLANIMDFKGAHIHGVYTKDNMIEPKTFFIVIEHPDLPIYRLGTVLERVLVTHASTYGENGSLIKVERVYPPKVHEVPKPDEFILKGDT